MANPRDHKSTYQRRNERAIKAGFRSYAHQREARLVHKQALDPEQKMKGYQRVKKSPKGLARTMREGHIALIERDWPRAQELGRRLPEDMWKVEGVPESAFYYHTSIV